MRSEAIHEFFELSYANYLVLHRALLQSMPEDWQVEFVTLLNRLDEAFDHIEHPEIYKVITGDLRELRGMTDEEIRSIGYDVVRGDPDLDEDDEYFNPDGIQIDPDMSAECVCWPKPDPIPHYNRGRAYIEPRIHKEGNEND